MLNGTAVCDVMLTCSVGDVSYNIASLEGSIMCIMGFTFPPKTEEDYNAYIQMKGYASTMANISSGILIPSAAPESGSSPAGDQMTSSYPPASHPPKGSQINTAASTPQKNYIFNNPSADEIKEDTLAMEELGEWLRDQQTMEDTIEILQKDGWML